jgi:Aspartyl protease/Zinc knuckle
MIVPSTSDKIPRSSPRQDRREKKRSLPQEQPAEDAGAGAALAPSRVTSKVRCFNCNNFGHYATECTQPKQPDAKKRKVEKGGKKPVKGGRAADGHQTRLVQTADIDWEVLNPDAAAYCITAYLVAAGEVVPEMAKVAGELACGEPLAENVTAVKERPIPRISSPRVDVLLNGQRFSAVLDTGAQSSFVSSGVLKALSVGAASTAAQSLSTVLADGSHGAVDVVRLSLRIGNQQAAEPYPFGVLQREDSMVLAGWDLISLFKLEIPVLSAAEVAEALAPFRVDPIDTVLATVSAEKAHGVIPHVHQQYLMEKIRTELEENRKTRGQKSKLPPIPIEMVDPKDRASKSWCKQFSMPEAYQGKYEEQVREWETEGIVEQ